MYTTITAAEAASLIKNGDSIGLSGFTPAGAPKATTKELAKLAQAEHEKGNPFKITCSQEHQQDRVLMVT